MWENMPPVYHTFGIPPKFACFLISLLGMGTGFILLAGLIIYSVFENTILVNEVEKMDKKTRMVVIMTVGLTGLQLLVANVLLFLGSSFSKRGAVAAFVCVTLTMCTILILIVAGIPLLCFFVPGVCFIGKLSMAGMVLGLIVVTGFLDVWLYFMAVGNSHGLTLQ